MAVLEGWKTVFSYLTWVQGVSLNYISELIQTAKAGICPANILIPN